MAGPFPSNGLAPGVNNSGVPLINPPATGCDALYYNEICAQKVDPKASNAMLSELVTLMNACSSERWDCARRDNVLRALRCLFGGLNAPVYPIVISDNCKLTVTAGAGQVTIPQNQHWLWRGQQLLSTSQFATPALTFATAPNRVYHLLWDASGGEFAMPADLYPIGRYALVDRTAAVPAETDASYDTTWDRMLVARVVTDGANVATVRTLRNCDRLWTSPTYFTTTAAIGAPGDIVANGPILFDTSNDWAGRFAASFTLDWSRTPKIAPVNGMIGISNFGSYAGHIEGAANYIYSRTVTRYDVTAKCMTDWNSVIGLYGGGLYVSGWYAQMMLDAAA